MSKIAYLNKKSNLSIKEKTKEILNLLGGLDKIIKLGDLVLIKPNFLAPFPHAVTDFEILEVIIEEVKRCRAKPVIGESSGFEFNTEKTFEILGAYEFAKRNEIELINFDKVKFTKVSLKNGLLKQISIPEIVLQADILINVPKLKRHNVTNVTIGMKNLFGLLPREDRRKFHALGIVDSGILALNKLIRSDLVIVDGLTVTSRALFGVSEERGIIVGGTDIVSVDKFCCTLLGIDFRNVRHIQKAIKEKLGLEEYQLVGDTPERLEIEKKSFYKKIYKLVYQTMHMLDIFYSFISKGKSLIPIIHFYLGVRPKLIKQKCDKCGKCVNVCPVNAINIQKGYIDSNLCMHIRCLKCVDLCPAKAIELRGERSVIRSVKRE
ncbi:MAG: DUF362 domain-containing protein [bacterium]